MARCPKCRKPLPEELEPKAINYKGKWMHRLCFLKASGQYALMVKLFALQDDPVEDPDTAMADLFGNLAHFAHSKGIDYAEAMRRGQGYTDEEAS